MKLALGSSWVRAWSAASSSACRGGRMAWATGKASASPSPYLPGGVSALDIYFVTRTGVA
jgi:hypothetical protein